MGSKVSHHHHYATAEVDAIEARLKSEYEAKLEQLKKETDQNYTKLVMELKKEYEDKREAEVQKALNLRMEEIERKDKEIRDEIDRKQAIVTEAALKLQKAFVDSGKHIEYKDLQNPDGTPFNKQKRLGAGAYGEVYEALFQGVKVAVKIYAQSSPDDDSAVASLYLEYKNIKQLSITSAAKNIAVLIGACSRPNLCLVTELVDGSNLFSILHKSHAQFTIQEALKYAVAIAEAMKSIHEAGAVHRDLKSENIMITGNGVKIIDFGQSKIRSIRSTTSNTSGRSKHTSTITIGNQKLLTTTKGMIGTPLYRSPENWEGSTKDWAKHDVFAFSIIMYELFTGLMPYHDSEFLDEFELRNAVLGTDKEFALRPTLPDNLPMGVLTLIEECWQHFPEDRPSFSQICDSLRNINTNDLGLSSNFKQQALLSQKPRESAKRTLNQSERIRQSRESAFRRSQATNQNPKQNHSLHSTDSVQPRSQTTNNSARYEVELKQLEEMGFTDRELVKGILIQCGGNIDQALNFLTN